MHGGISGLAFNVPSRAGWHRHHLIPREIYRYPDLGRFVAGLEQDGFMIGDFATNGMFLPSNPETAFRASLPLHNGPHRTYNDIVIGTMERVRSTVERHRAGRKIGAYLGKLYQDRLRRDLVSAGRSGAVLLGSRDPFGRKPYLAGLDARTDAMIAAAMTLSDGGETPAHCSGMAVRPYVRT